METKDDAKPVVLNNGSRVEFRAMGALIGPKGNDFQIVFANGSNNVEIVLDKDVFAALKGSIDKAF